jgi:hypothetical protein
VLHVRVVSPPDRTARLVAALAANSGVQNLVVMKGTAQLPDGDAVQFDAQNRPANPVLRELRGLDLSGQPGATGSRWD